MKPPLSFSAAFGMPRFGDEEHPAAAYAVVEDLRTFVTTTLLANPEIGRKANHLEPGVRVFVKGNYRICYRVRPGVLLVRANPFRPVIALIALDFPAFERPAKATSTPTSGGNPA